MLTPDECARYKRQLLIKGWDNEKQEILKKSTVFIAGAGGLGSPVLSYLAAAGVGTLHICDFDRVDISNLNRQVLHGTGTVGNLKTDSAAETLRRINEHVTIEKITEKITADNAGDMIKGADCIADCLDSLEARMILNRAAAGRRIPVSHGGINGFRGQCTFLNPPETPCLACFITQKDTGGPVPALGAAAGVIGSIQAMEILKHLTGLGETMKNRLMLFDGLLMRTEYIKIKRNPDCPVCGGLSG
ncbi:MAG TPA: HesA/MoeB/ThiF family protein [Spirochaetota bacterium]|nr:HesA/MoeB/ThiF family protein [Spirochaetota bacterium]